MVTNFWLEFEFDERNLEPQLSILVMHNSYALHINMHPEREVSEFLFINSLMRWAILSDEIDTRINSDIRSLIDSKGFKLNHTVEMVYYIACPYNTNKIEGIARSIKACENSKYWDKQCFPYSPILVSYPVETQVILKKLKIDWIKWDLTLLDLIPKKNLVMVFPKDWEASGGCRKEMEYAEKRGVTIEMGEY